MNSEQEKKTRTCVLCGKEFTEWPNNPWPLSFSGVCCKRCDDERVTPARIRIIERNELRTVGD